MSRPVYETEENTRAEREIATIFADKMGFDVIRPTRKMSEFDFIVVRKGTTDVVGILEVKARDYTWADFANMGGVMIDHEKWVMLQLHTNAYANAWLVVRDKAGDVRWTTIPSGKRPRLKITGRSDRNDAQDIGIKAIIPVGNFIGEPDPFW